MCDGFETAAECLEALGKLEVEFGCRYSMYCCADENFHPLADDGAVRDVACTTKREYPSKSQAHKSQKVLARQGRRALVAYECWYGDHWHLGHKPGQQTYKRPGRVYG